MSNDHESFGTVIWNIDLHGVKIINMKDKTTKWINKDMLRNHGITNQSTKYYLSSLTNLFTET